jgi:transcriptional regulator with XRE-family HTH domain
MSAAYVDLALKTLGIKQKELAKRLGVSPPQITKWKNNEYMSEEMEGKIAKLLNIGGLDPSVVAWAGSVKDARKWSKLFEDMAKTAVFGAETGYGCYPLENESGLLALTTVNTLFAMGIPPPNGFPKELEGGDDDDEDEVRENNPYYALVGDIYQALTDVYGFYAAYVDDLVCHDRLIDILGTAENIEPCLMTLAASKLERVDDSFAPGLQKFRYETERDYTKWLMSLKESAIEAGIPLRAELLDMVNCGDDELGHKAEAEALGFNKTRLHPDIYMNEILVGMRTIHQVLPAIMKKLEIFDDFELDRSELRNVSRHETDETDEETSEPASSKNQVPDSAPSHAPGSLDQGTAKADA